MSSDNAFWTTSGVSGYEPKMPWRFRVFIEGFQYEDDQNTTLPYQDAKNDPDFVWYAKSIEKPSIKIGQRAAKDVTLDQPQVPICTPNSVPEMNTPIVMKLIDPSYPNATRKLLRLFRRAGYNDLKATKVHTSTATKPKFKPKVLLSSVGTVKFTQLDYNGRPLETWELVGAFPTEINFGTLDYSSDTPVEISVTWGMQTWFTTEHGNGEVTGGRTHSGDAMTRIHLLQRLETFGFQK